MKKVYHCCNFMMDTPPNLRICAWRNNSCSFQPSLLFRKERPWGLHTVGLFEGYIGVKKSAKKNSGENIQIGIVWMPKHKIEKKNHPGNQKLPPKIGRPNCQ